MVPVVDSVISHANAKKDNRSLQKSTFVRVFVIEDPEVLIRDRFKGSRCLICLPPSACMHDRAPTDLCCCAAVCWRRSRREQGGKERGKYFMNNILSFKNALSHDRSSSPARLLPWLHVSFDSLPIRFSMQKYLW